MRALFVDCAKCLKIIGAWLAVLTLPAVLVVLAVLCRACLLCSLVCCAWLLCLLCSLCCACLLVGCAGSAVVLVRSLAVLARQRHQHNTDKVLHIVWGNNTYKMGISKQLYV